MNEELDEISARNLAQIRKNSTYAISFGVIIVMLGILAMGSPLVTGLALAIMVGSLLLFGGVAQLLFGIKSHTGIFNVILGVLTIIAGGFMASNPAVAMGTITVLIVVYLVVSGTLDVLFAFHIKPVPGWVWSLISGIISFLLGLMIWSQSPVSGTWAIGVSIGIRLFVNGLMLLMLGLNARAAQ